MPDVFEKLKRYLSTGRTEPVARMRKVVRRGEVGSAAERVPRPKPTVVDPGRDLDWGPVGEEENVELTDEAQQHLDRRIKELGPQEGEDQAGVDFDLARARYKREAAGGGVSELRAKNAKVKARMASR